MVVEVKVIEKKNNRLWVSIKGVPIQYANALRRICLNQVPIMAIDSIDVIKNFTVMTDEDLAHRLGMIPLKTNLTRFAEPHACKCNSEIGCINCRVMLVLQADSRNETYTVMSDELISEDTDVKPTSQGIPIAILAPGQSIHIEAYARLGRGTEHAKWNSSNIAVLIPGDNPEEYVLIVEGTGALSPEMVINKAVEELGEKMKEFKSKVKELNV
ncbi:MAG: DNA-directed RNA polymerase subunit D [Candidatus Nitrosoabyssus spongiisocia]|nr:MAG: DNA-directed RNA polymerase subunit D [Nitrosopumilaceae archaeon AB1(1)]